MADEPPATTGPPATGPLPSPPGGQPPPPTIAGEGVPTGPPLMGPPLTTPSSGATTADQVERPASPWWQRWWLITAVAVAIIAALVTVIVTQQIGQNDTQDQLATATRDLRSVTAERDQANSQLGDRASQQAADEAAVARIDAEQRAAQRQAEQQAEEQAVAAEEQAAADAAQQAAQAEEEARNAEAEQERRNTLPGDGIVAIGLEKNPGTYRTDGPARGRSCYYAVLSAPSGPGVSNIIDNNNTDGPGIVTLANGQYFEASGCSVWRRQS